MRWRWQDVKCLFGFHDFGERVDHRVCHWCGKDWYP